MLAQPPHQPLYADVEANDVEVNNAEMTGAVETDDIEAGGIEIADLEQPAYARIGYATGLARGEQPVQKKRS